MRVFAAAFDYDETLARNGAVKLATVEALRRLKTAGWRLVLVTGRELPDLLQILPFTNLFDRVVAENGGVLYSPRTQQHRALSEPPPKALIDELRREGVTPLTTGQVLLATREPHEERVLAAIHKLGIEYHIIFNKGAVMVLPSSVNKATGLTAALKEMRIHAENVAGIGDAENDHAFLSLCGYSAAVANALPALKEHVDRVMEAEDGDGVLEFIEWLLSAEGRETMSEISQRAETTPLKRVTDKAA